MPVHYDIVLQTEQADGSFHCRGFSSVPAASRSWIAITSTGAAAGRKSAADLAEELKTALLASSPEVSMEDFDCGVAPSGMQPKDQADRLKLLVLVGDEGCKFTDKPWYHNWDSDKNRSGLMILLPPGTYEDFFDPSLRGEENASHLLRRINTVSWSKNVAEVVPSVLGRAEVTSSINRIFISYRRVETLPIALQLFDRLTHERFDVFLDRFSIEPGVDFQRRLTQELEEKSMVVLLESKHLSTSKWTQHEIDFAKRRRLGLIAFRMPDVKDEELLRSVNDAREPLECADFKKKPEKVKLDGVEVNQWQELLDKPGEALDRIIAKIKSAHAAALFLRRHRLRSELVKALGAEGVTVAYSAVGPLKVTHGGNDHVLWPTTRPPQVDDFRSVHGVFYGQMPPRPATSRAVIVGPMAALEPDRQEQLEWLHKVSQCRTFDEGNLAELARKLAAGVLP